MITDAQIEKMTLAEYIAALNKCTTDWVNEKPEDRFAGLLTDDLDHWKEYNITTASALGKYLDGEAA